MQGKRKRAIWVAGCLSILFAGVCAGCAKEGADPSTGQLPAVEGQQTEAVLPPAAATEGEAAEEMEEVEELVEDAADRVEIDRLLEDFSNAYFAADEDAIAQYLSENYTGEIDLYDRPDQADEVVKNSVQELEYAETGEIGDTCTRALVFINPGEDSYTYLTVEFVKEESGWRVSFYGLEK